MPLSESLNPRWSQCETQRPGRTSVQAALFAAWIGTCNRGRNLRGRLADERGAVAIEYVIVAIALLAIAGAIAAALTTLGDDAVQQIPGSVSEVGS